MKQINVAVVGLSGVEKGSLSANPLNFTMHKLQVIVNNNV